MATSLIVNQKLPIMAISANVSATIGAGRVVTLGFPFPPELKNDWYAISWYKGGASDATGRNNIIVCPAAFTMTLGNTNFIALNTASSEWSGTIQLGYILAPKAKIDYSWQSIG